MAVRIGNASIDEHGAAHGGKAGDQTGKEVLIKNWYKHKKGWRLIRAKDYLIAGRIAEAMEAACANDLIGYDQYERDTLLKKSKPVGYDPAQVTVACECDCSSLVRVCIAFAYREDAVAAWAKGARFSTANMCAILLSSGEFVEGTESEAQTDKWLRRGDILVTKTQGHTVVVLDDGPDASYTDRPEIDIGEEDECPYSKPNVTISRKKNRKAVGIKWIQWHLNRIMEGEPQLAEDGIYGPLTEKAVRSFQAYAGIAVDGITGPVTCRALVSEWAFLCSEAVELGEYADDPDEDPSAGAPDGIACGPGDQAQAASGAAWDDDFDPAGEIDPDAGGEEDPDAAWEQYLDDEGMAALPPDEAEEVARELARSEREGD